MVREIRSAKPRLKTCLSNRIQHEEIIQQVGALLLGAVPTILLFIVLVWPINF